MLYIWEKGSFRAELLVLVFIKKTNEQYSEVIMRIMDTFSVDILNEIDVSCCKLGKDFSFKGV